MGLNWSIKAQGPFDYIILSDTLAYLDDIEVIEIDGNVTVGTNAKQVLGGMYTIVLRNTASSTKNVSFDDANMVFANNIKPSRISGYGNLVISMVCTVANGELLCTYADFA